MSNDQPARRPPAKSSGGGAPMGSTISIVIAVVAVVVGFIILRNINDTGDGGGGSSTPNITDPDRSDNSTETTAAPTITTAPGILTPTTVPLNLTAKVVVANASGQKGAAANATQELQTVGFVTGEPTDAFGPEKTIAMTKVYYVAGAELTAASVAQVFSSAAAPILTFTMPAPIPVKGATIGDATVLVMVGTDLANKPLPAIAAATPDTSVATTTTIG
jgi:LytR cell envelope-related transcriptional attenuator